MKAKLTREEKRTAELLEIVETLYNWYCKSPFGEGPNAKAILFDDDYTLHQHLAAVFSKGVRA